MEHFYQNIDGWFNCQPLYKRMIDQAKDGSVFVEVGVWKGKSAAFMGVEILNSKKKIEFYAIDHFQGSEEHQNLDVIKSKRLKEECYKNLEPLLNVVRMLPISSLTAAAMFADESIDFTYIDGSHEYDDLKADIDAWLPKVKPGGIIAGDDYNNGMHPDVNRIIDKMFPNCHKEGLVWIHKKPL